MLSTTKHSWRRTLLQAVVLYVICMTALVWLLPPPVHFQFSCDRISRQFSPTTESSLVRLYSTDKHPAVIRDYFIDHVDLKTAATKHISLDPGDQSLARAQEYIHSRDGSLFLMMNGPGFNTVSAWDGGTGKFRFEKFCVAKNWKQMACSADSSLIALLSQDDSGDIDIYEALTGNSLGHLSGLHGTTPQYVVDLQFSLDNKWLLCRYSTRNESSNSKTYIFDLSNFSTRYNFGNTDPEDYEIIPALNGFWISHWDRSNEKLILTYLDGQTGQRTALAPTLSRRLAGFPHIFSDNAGHLYLLQNRKPPPDDWQQRVRKTLIGWLSKIGIDWETTDEIELRHISLDGKRIIAEQTFSANYAEISPDGQYLILMSQMKNDSKYVVYHYPTRLNWKHSLFWPLIPAMLLLLLRWRGIKSHASSPHQQ